MGKAKQAAAARANELLKSYSVNLNSDAGTYRLVNKATGKEENVADSGVDVGTSIFAKGRRMNRLIGKNLVKNSGELPVSMSSQPQRPTNSTMSGETMTPIRGIPMAHVTAKGAPALIGASGVEKQKLMSRYTPKLGTSSTVETEPIPTDMKFPSLFDMYGSSYRPTKYPLIASTGTNGNGTTKNSRLLDYYTFRFKALSKPLQNTYKTPEAYGKTLNLNENSEDVVKYAAQKAIADKRDSAPTNAQKLATYFSGLNPTSSAADIQRAYQITGGRTR